MANNMLAFYAAVLTHLLDAGLTYYGVTRGVDTEGNPIVAWCIVHIGWIGAFVVTKVPAIGTFYLLARAGFILELWIVIVLAWLIAIIPWSIGIVQYLS